MGYPGRHAAGDAVAAICPVVPAALWRPHVFATSGHGESHWAPSVNTDSGLRAEGLNVGAQRDSGASSIRLIMPRSRSAKGWSEGDHPKASRDLGDPTKVHEHTINGSRSDGVRSAHDLPPRSKTTPRLIGPLARGNPDDVRFWTAPFPAAGDTFSAGGDRPTLTLAIISRHSTSAVTCPVEVQLSTHDLGSKARGRPALRACSLPLLPQPSLFGLNRRCCTAFLQLSQPRGVGQLQPPAPPAFRNAFKRSTAAAGGGMLRSGLHSVVVCRAVLEFPGACVPRDCCHHVRAIFAYQRQA